MIVLVALVALLLPPALHAFLVPTMRVPHAPPQRKHSSLPVPKPGMDLGSLLVNQQLSGSVVSLYDGTTSRKLFVDAGVTRTDKKGRHFPVFGMVRLQGPYENMTYAYGHRLNDLYVDEVHPGSGRLVLSLTPVYKRPVRDDKGKPLPIHKLQDLEVGMALNGTVVSVTENYAFVDAGVVWEKEIREEAATATATATARRRKKPKPRRLNGRLYRLDLQEQYALSPKYKTATTEAVLVPGMSLPVWVKGVHVDSWQYTLTVDPNMTSEKALALKAEREAQVKSMESKQPVDALLIGESRKGVITKLLPGGCKVGIGVKKTGFVPLDSIAEAYGKDIRDLGKVLVVGGRMQVEVDEISADGERIDLRCLEIYKQEVVKKKPAAKAAAAPPPAAKKTARRDDDSDSDDEEGIAYEDDSDEEDGILYGGMDEW